MLSTRHLRRRQQRPPPAPGDEGWLPGRRELDAHLNEAIAGSGDVTLALFAVNGLKAFSLAHSESSTDRLLADVAAQLRAVEGAAAFRLRDGSFALVLPEPAHLAEQRCDGCTQLPWRSTASIGLAAARPDDDASSLRSRAEFALSQARRRGAGTIVHAPPQHAGEPPVTPPRAQALIALLRGGDVRIHYQPILHAHEHRLIGFEAFARPQLTHDLGGPLDAFALAERLDLAPALDALCRSAIFEDGPGFHMPPAGRLHVNLSPLALGHRSLSARQLHEQVRDAGLTPARVVFELREHPAVDLEALDEELRSLRLLGFGLALDDIGGSTGGLATLQLGTFDVLKLAPSVVGAVGKDRHADATVDAVAAFADRVDATVIASGVETAEQLRTLRSCRAPCGAQAITGVQGHHIGRPTPTPDARRHFGATGGGGASDGGSATARTHPVRR